MYPHPGNQVWITSYGLMLVLALLACWAYARRRATSMGIDESQIDLAVPLIFIVSTVGARALTLVSPGDLELAGGLLETHVRFRLFGLLLFAFPLLYFYSRAARISFRRMLDVLALPAVLWLIVLRAGCFMAGCCWGDIVYPYPELAAVTDPSAWHQVQTISWLTGDWVATATSFPAGSLAWEQQVSLGLIGADAVSSLPIHPTQLYALFVMAAWLMFLQRVSHKVQVPGMLAVLMFSGYAVLRFLIEFIRADSVLVLGNLTFTQLLCIALLAGCGFSTSVLRRKSVMLAA
jgi:phosphatidylglycerol:prolipoprotein diacylglycerol transferase